MARTSKATRRDQRQRAKLQEAAVSALLIGIALLVVPMFISNPILKPMASALRTPAWLAIVFGAVLLGLGKLKARAGEALRTEAGPEELPSMVPVKARRSGSARELSDSPVIPDVITRESLPEKSSPLAPPTRPESWSGSVFDVIEWRRFEAVCESLFSQAGFEAKSQSHGADGGIDIWLFSKNSPGTAVSVVQCKHWTSKPVGVAEVRALLGSMADKKVPRGIFATTSTFTPDATRFAGDNKIQLLDREGLLALVQKRTPEQQRDLLAVATEGEYWIPTCASCGVKMMRRERKSGGRPFWGCVNFPRCRTVING